MTDISADAMPAAAPAAESDPLLSGIELYLGVAMLGLVTFLVVLDITIINVILPAIASGFGAAPHEVTMGITVFAAAQAIVMPLTGWLTTRFGIVRVFLISLVCYGVASFFCGVAPSLTAFLVARFLQGLTAGPMLPLSQTLLQRCVPKRQLPMAYAFWTITMSAGPVAGPALGGLMADTIGWPWGFFINIPVLAVCVALGWKIFGSRESATVKAPVDLVGLGLLVVWVASLQLFLDKGRELEWFANPVILTLAIAAGVCFVAFMIWEFTDRHPLIDFSVFRYRSFRVCTPISAVSFSAQAVATLLATLWMQLAMNYNATTAGYTVAASGVACFVAGPIAALGVRHIGGRAVVFLAMGLNGCNMLWRANFDATTDLGLVVISQVIGGLAATCAMMPLMSLAMSDIPKDKLAAAASTLTFIRVLALGCLTAVITTIWQNGQNRAHDLIAGGFNVAGRGIDALPGPPDQALLLWNGIVDRESLILATAHANHWMALYFFIGPALIWLCPKPRPIEG